MRTRLALVLAGIMVGPLLAVSIVVGVLVPRAAARATDTELRRALAATSTVLAERCLGLGDLARSGAAALAATGGSALDPATAAAVLGPLPAARPGVTLALVVTGAPAARVAAATGALPAGWDPAADAAASCSHRIPPRGSTRPPALLAESASLPGGLPGRVVAVQSIDAAALSGVRETLGADVRLALVADGSTPVAVSAGWPGHEADAALDRVAAGAGTGGADAAGGWHYRQVVSPPGVPYSLVALAKPAPAALQRTLAAAVALASLVLLGVLGVVASRLVGPIAELTAVARRFGGGDLRARTGIRGTDEVGTLAAAFDAMADELQLTVEELRASQNALAHTFARFGEALGATHDLDALLRTVVAAAQRGSDAALGVAYLGDTKGLDAGAASLPEGTVDPTTAEALAGLADLAEDAVRRGELVVTDLVDAAGPALAVPLTRDERVIGALAVAREVGSAPFDRLAVEAVTALAAHAGTAVGNVRIHEETSRQSITDPLTGAGNFRHLTATMAKEVERASRFNRPLSLLMLDLDHFKQVNDTAGHAFGDAVLREFARRLAACLREVDVVARYGGEEFVVVLPETAAEGACAVATRIVEAVRSEPFRAGGKSRSVTVSVGVSAFPDHGRTTSELMRSADGALYEAKHNGRDRWVLAGRSTGPGVAVAQTG